MKTFIIPITWLLGSDHGYGNGYVALPPDHKLHGTPYDDIDVDVHGGLTFGELGKDMKHKPDNISNEDWIIGFDTAHYSDTMVKWPKEKVEAELESLVKQLEAL
jgi:hypothetical protein